jgi:hypothetical protein
MSGNDEIIDNIVDFEEEDFEDVISKEAELAQQAQKKDEKTTDGKRQGFDSADYWMKQQEAMGKTNTGGNSNK